MEFEVDILGMPSNTTSNRVFLRKTLKRSKSFGAITGQMALNEVIIKSNEPISKITFC